MCGSEVEQRGARGVFTSSFFLLFPPKHIKSEFKNQKENSKCIFTFSYITKGYKGTHVLCYMGRMWGSFRGAECGI